MIGLDRILDLFRKRELDCVEVRKLSSEYLEGTLAPSRMQRLRAHLSKCSICQSFVDSLASVMSMLTSLPRVESPSNLKQSILQRIEEDTQNRGR